MCSEPNKRDFTRVPSGLDVDILMEDGCELAGRVQNVSMRGIFVPTERAFEEGVKCRVMLHLGGRGHGITLEARGEVARSSENGLGVRFDEIAYNAFQHLRKLVRYNADDPGVIEEELNSHLGIREGE